MSQIQNARIFISNNLFQYWSNNQKCWLSVADLLIDNLCFFEAPAGIIDADERYLMSGDNVRLLIKQEGVWEYAVPEIAYELGIIPYDLIIAPRTYRLVQDAQFPYIEQVNDGYILHIEYMTKRTNEPRELYLYFEK